MQLGGPQERDQNFPERQQGSRPQLSFVPAAVTLSQQPSAFHYYSPLSTSPLMNPLFTPAQLHVTHVTDCREPDFHSGSCHGNGFSSSYVPARHLTRGCAPLFHSLDCSSGSRLSSSQPLPWNYGACSGWRILGSQFVPIQPRPQFPIHSSIGSVAQVPCQEVIEQTLTCGQQTAPQERVVPDGFTDLREALEADASVEVGTRLLQYFVKCDLDPSDRIREILSELGSYFVNHFSCVTGDSYGRTAVKYFLLSTRLYYRVLQSLLEKEAIRLPEKDFSSLLGQESLHRLLIACSAEVVMFCYGNTKTLRGLSDIVCFPWIIEVFNIEPFKFLKMIETFILSEPLLSLDLINHLHQIEASIIDTLAWESKSTLFQLVSDIDVVKCLTETEGLPSHLVVARTVQNTLNEYSKSPVLHLFYRKVRQLTYCRLQLLCSDLGIDAALEEKIWTLLQFVLTCTPSLVKHRCIDQILLCSVYGMCKVINQELQFKHIVTHYRQLPSASPEVYRHVYIQPGQYNSVIVFYNMVFMPTLKVVLLKFLPEKQAVATLPPPDFVKAPYAEKPCKATSGLNVYVSPMRAGGGTLKLTPRTRALYSFGDSIGSPCRSASLQYINDMMKQCAKKGSLKKRLKFKLSSNTRAAINKSTVSSGDIPLEQQQQCLVGQMVAASAEKEYPLFSPGLLQQLTELARDRDFLEAMATSQ